MRREILILTGLLFLSLIPAYWSSLPFDAITADQAPIFSLKETLWKQIWYRDPTQTVRVFLEKGSLWAEHTSGDEKSLFRVTSAPDAAVVEFLSPLRSIRDLGVVASDNLAEYGLKDSATSLEIELQSGEIQPVYQVGIRNFGTRFYFVKESQSGQVYLIDGKIVDVLAQAKIRLFERFIVGSDVAKANRVEVIIPGKKSPRTFILSKDGYDPQGEVSWQLQGSKDATTNTKINTWLDKVSKLYAVKYSQIEPTTDPIFEVVYFLGSKQIDTLKIFKEIVGDQPLYLARSNFSQSSVEINQTRMAQVEGDLAVVFP